MKNGLRPLGILFVFFLLLMLLGLAREAGSGFLSGPGGSDGAHVDLVVRKVSFSPVRARVGDVVTVEMVFEYWGGISNNYYDSTWAEAHANGRVVARKPFTYGPGGHLGEEYRETLLWDTRGMAPGKYRIRGEVYLRLDATPYDNFLDVREPLTLFSEGAALPEGEEIGGIAVAENRFWLERKGPKAR